MIAIRLAVHPALQTIDDAKLRLEKTLDIIRRLFNLVMPFIATLLITAVIFIVYFGFKTPITHTKEAIITVMIINYSYMYIKRAKAQKLLLQNRLSESKEQIKLFANVLLPLNIALGILAIVLGVLLKF